MHGEPGVAMATGDTATAEREDLPRR
jgi:hypothetical protein